MHDTQMLGSIDKLWEHACAPDAPAVGAGAFAGWMGATSHLCQGDVWVRLELQVCHVVAVVAVIVMV